MQTSEPSCVALRKRKSARSSSTWSPTSENFNTFAKLLPTAACSEPSQAAYLELKLHCDCALLDAIYPRDRADRAWPRCSFVRGPRAMSVIQLSDRVRRELTYVSYPPREWTLPRSRDGAKVLDVLIVGAGQSGLATAFGLKLERITNIRIVDRSPRGLEGPWRRFARMK